MWRRAGREEGRANLFWSGSFSMIINIYSIIINHLYHIITSTAFTGVLATESRDQIHGWVKRYILIRLLNINFHFCWKTSYKVSPAIMCVFVCVCVCVCARACCRVAYICLCFSLPRCPDEVVLGA